MNGQLNVTSRPLYPLSKEPRYQLHAMLDGPMTMTMVTVSTTPLGLVMPGQCYSGLVGRVR